MSGGGKRRAATPARRTPKLDSSTIQSLLLPAAGVTFCIVAWGYLVTAAIDFGASARGGETAAWTYLLIACIGAMACLFAGLILAARVLAEFGLLSSPRPEQEHEPEEHRPAGGRRIKR